MTSTTSQVEVAVDPATAFAVFTEEMDLWWVRGPINFFDASRAIAQRCEPGVGGRLLEVYDDATGDALELGRITVWEPGSRLSWHSSVDDVLIDVRFEASAGGTTVRVDAHVPPDGADRGGSAWVRVGPPWFGAWCARRDHVAHVPAEVARLALAVSYAKPATAARWLADVFGFTGPDSLPDDDSERTWIEFRIGNCSLVIFRLDGVLPEELPPTHVPWVYVDDLDAHFAHAQSRGATIIEGIHQHGYRAYVAQDLEGHRWTFAQARPTMV